MEEEADDDLGQVEDVDENGDDEEEGSLDLCHS